MGDGLVAAAMPLLVSHLTDNGVWVGLTYSAQRIPWMFAIVTGALVDRSSPRRAMVVADLGRAVILAIFSGLLLAEIESPALAVGAVFLIGIFDSVFFAASTSIIRALVPRSELGRANGYNFAVQTGGDLLIGPPLGAFLFRRSARFVPFLGDAISFASSAFWLRGLPEPELARAAPQRLGAQIADGWRGFWDNLIIRWQTVLVASFVLAQSMCLGSQVLLITRQLDLTDLQYGWYLATQAIGVIGGYLIADRIAHRFGNLPAVSWSAAACGVCFFVVGVAPSWPMAFALMTAHSFAVGVLNVANGVVRQTYIPTALIGRVANLFRIGIYIGVAIGGPLGGLISTRTKPSTTFVVAGIICVIGVVLTFLPLRNAFAVTPEADD